VKTAVLKGKMLEALRDSRGNITKACQAANIDRKTHYKWLENDPAYADAAREIHEELHDVLEDHLYRLAVAAERESDQIRATEIYLKARAKDRGYGVEKRDQSVSGELNVNATVQDVRFELPLNDTEQGSAAPMPPGWDKNTQCLKESP
jgi:hypothetical protein